MLIARGSRGLLPSYNTDFKVIWQHSIVDFVLGPGWGSLSSIVPDFGLLVGLVAGEKKLVIFLLQNFLKLFLPCLFLKLSLSSTSK